MLKKWLIGGILATGCSFAQAADAPSTWNFNWDGFKFAGQFRPDISYPGTFTGSDTNHDGTIDLSELTSFGMRNSIDGPANFLNCPAGPAWHTVSCSVSSFSYKLGGSLEFSATRWDSVDTGGDYRFDTEQIVDSHYGVLYNLRQGMYSDYYSYDVTPQTVLTVQLAPVPEPEAYAMLGAGLLMLAGLGSRKKKQ